MLDAFKKKSGFHFPFRYYSLPDNDRFQLKQAGARDQDMNLPDFSECHPALPALAPTKRPYAAPLISGMVHGCLPGRLDFFFIRIHLMLYLAYSWFYFIHTGSKFLLAVALAHKYWTHFRKNQVFIFHSATILFQTMTGLNLSRPVPEIRKWTFLIFQMSPSSACL